MVAYITNEFGLRQRDMDYMFSLFKSVPSIDKVILFGSRATGNHRKGSDVDIALAGAQITSRDVLHIYGLLENEVLHCLGSMYCITTHLKMIS